MSQARPASDRIGDLHETKFWKTGPLGWALARTPLPVKIALRRLLKAIYWTLTPHRMPARIAFLREQRARNVDGGGRAARVQDLAQAKAQFRRTRLRELTAFLKRPGRLRLPASEAPKVSIVLILYNQAELTLHCLRSLGSPEVPTEVIILDNGSTDRTGELLDRLDGARVIRSPENLHFLRGVNRAAAEARGEAILLLNNDTWVEPGSIAAAWARLSQEPDVGAVGGRIVLPNGTLQEAGSIVWRDGSCLGYGRGRSPDDPEFGFPRDVDYCSGAFLMVRRSAWEGLGGFDEAFAPAYYEETDLCMRLRGAGLRVVYEPAVRLTHFEFGSAGKPGALALQSRNRALFIARHAAALERSHRPAGSAPLEARMRDRSCGRILIIDDRAPVGSLGTGLPRAADILAAARATGWLVTHYPLQFPNRDASVCTVANGMETIFSRGVPGLPDFLAERSGYYDAVLVSRPHNMAEFQRALAQAPDFTARTGLIYDAEAIFARREAMKRRVLGGAADPAQEAREAAEELSLAAEADVVLSVSEGEAAAFRSAARGEVRVLGHAIEADPTPAGFDKRSGLLFVGALDDEDSPNVDSVVWFVEEVMPRLDALVGRDWTLTLAGRSQARRIRALEGPRIRVMGRVEDLRPLYGTAKALIAPTRFAAGLPMKVHEAAGAGVPAVVTGLIARQLGWRDGEVVLAADTAQDFAEACRTVMSDAALWLRLREGALAAVRRDCDPSHFRQAVAELLAIFEGRRRAAERN